MRLLRREEYRAALAMGAANVRRYFAVFDRPNGLAHARVGIITARRVARRAVDRNRAKRLIREAFRNMRQGLGGMDIVFELRRCPPPTAGAAARSEIARLLQELESRARHGE